MRMAPSWAPAPTCSVHAGDAYYPHSPSTGNLPPTRPSSPAHPAAEWPIRLINAGGDTAFRFAIGGTASPTHTDGFPVEPVEVDSVLLGMGERYDLLVTLGDARSHSWHRPKANANAPSPCAPGRRRSTSIGCQGLELDSDWWGRHRRDPHRYRRGSRRQGCRPGDHPDAHRLDGRLRLGHQRPVRPDPAAARRAGGPGRERVRLRLVNETEMWYPFHLHGCTQHSDGGPRKDTSIILPKQTLTIDFDADNPGQWAAHCHNIYHAETGMMTVIGYQT